MAASVAKSPPDGLVLPARPPPPRGRGRELTVCFAFPEAYPRVLVGPHEQQRAQSPLPVSLISRWARDCLRDRPCPHSPSPVLTKWRRPGLLSPGAPKAAKPRAFPTLHGTTSAPPATGSHPGIRPHRSAPGPPHVRAPGADTPNLAWTTVCSAGASAVAFPAFSDRSEAESLVKIVSRVFNVSYLPPDNRSKTQK